MNMEVLNFWNILLLMVAFGIVLWVLANWFKKWANVEIGKEPKTGVYEIFDCLIAVGVWFAGMKLLPKFVKNYDIFTLLYLLMTVVIIAIFTLARRRNFSDIGLSKKNIRKMLIFTIIMFGVTFAYNLCALYFKISPYPIKIEIMSLKTALIIIGMGIINPGLIEELLFRGFVLSKLERFLNWKWALLISAVLFGIIHVGQGIFPIMGSIYLGLLFGYVFHCVRNIIPLVIGHGVGLTTAIVVANLLRIL